jgi:phosphatidylglycerophosphate synthase
MKINVGMTDKIIRVLIVIGLIIAGVITTWWPLYIFAGALLITVFTGFCGLYALFGMTTCPRKVVAAKTK